MFAQESKYLKRELETAGKDVSAWAARPLSFEGEGKANLGASPPLPFDSHSTPAHTQPWPPPRSCYC